MIKLVVLAVELFYLELSKLMFSLPVATQRISFGKYVAFIIQTSNPLVAVLILGSVLIMVWCHEGHPTNEEYCCTSLFGTFWKQLIKYRLNLENVYNIAIGVFVCYIGSLIFLPMALNV